MPIYIEHDYYPMDILTDLDPAYRGPMIKMQTLAADPDREERGQQFMPDETVEKINNKVAV